jgi:hypothetical protein
VKSFFYISFGMERNRKPKREVKSRIQSEPAGN